MSSWSMALILSAHAPRAQLSVYGVCASWHSPENCQFYEQAVSNYCALAAGKVILAAPDTSSPLRTTYSASLEGTESRAS